MISDIIEQSGLGRNMNDITWRIPLVYSHLARLFHNCSYILHGIAGLHHYGPSLGGWIAYVKYYIPMLSYNLSIAVY